VQYTAVDAAVVFKCVVTTLYSYYVYRQVLDLSGAKGPSLDDIGHAAGQVADNTDGDDVLHGLWKMANDDDGVQVCAPLYTHYIFPSP
jgi:hypothetical protein